jgi:uncharacterized protein (DUF952 family)
VAGVSRIYHIAVRADWERALADGAYTRSTVDRTLAEEGFIHASAASQVARTANAYYRDSTPRCATRTCQARTCRSRTSTGR